MASFPGPDPKMGAMNTTEIVQQLRAERDKLNAAIRALEGVAGAGLREARTRLQLAGEGSGSVCRRRPKPESVSQMR